MILAIRTKSTNTTILSGGGIIQIALRATMRKYLMLALALLAGFAAYAQAPTATVTFSGGWRACTPYCATAPCTATTITATVTNQPSQFAYVWDILGGIEEVPNSRTNPSAGVYTIQIRSKAGNYCRGRVKFSWSERGGDCPPGFSAQQEIFKTFSRNQMDDTWTTLYGGQVGTIVGPTCLTPGTRVTYSIHPFVSTCTSDGLGQDSYRWVLPASWTNPANNIRIYYSGDSSSITISALPSGTVGAAGTTALESASLLECFIGTRCNGQVQGYPAGNRYFLNLARTPSLAFIVGTGLNGQNAGSSIVNASGCIPANSTANFTLRCDPDESGAPQNFTYEWDALPPGFSLASGSTLTSRSITVTPTAPGSAGIFTVTVKNPSGGCGPVKATYKVARTTTTTNGYNFLTVNPICFDSANTGAAGAAGEIVITLNNASTGQLYEWIYPTAEYDAVPPTNTNVLRLRPKAGATNFQISVRSTGNTITGPPQTVNCQGDFITANISINSNGGSSTPVFIYRTPSTRSFTLTANSNGTGIWYPGTCDVGNFSYQWSYIGKYTTSGGAVNNYPTATSSSTVFGSGSTSGTTSLNAGTYAGITSGPGFLQCLIVQNNGNLCPQGNCFRKLVKFALPTTPIMPPVNGDNNPYQSGSRTGLEEVNSLELQPNPATSEVLIKLQQVDEGASILITSVEGKVVRKITAVKDAKVNLRGLPKGIYRVTYLDAKSGTLSTNLVVE